MKTKLPNIIAIANLSLTLLGLLGTAVFTNALMKKSYETIQRLEYIKGKLEK